MEMLMPEEFKHEQHEMDVVHDDDVCKLCEVINLGVKEEAIATGDVVVKDVVCRGLGISV